MDVQVQTAWPFLALLLSIVLAAPLLFQTADSSTASASLFRRLNNWRWCMQLALPLYALHQFEEYGLDLYGRHYYFHNMACKQLGYPSLAACPIQAWHLAFVNVVLVNLAALRARGKTRFAAVGPGANFYGLALVNGVLHSGVAVLHAAAGQEAYNPGLLTGLGGLFPVGVFALRGLHRDGLLSGRGVVRAVVVGLLANVLLLGSMPLRAQGYVGDVGYVVLGTVNIVGLLSIASPV